jgi:pyruvate formate lyase activating enzyme
MSQINDCKQSGTVFNIQKYSVHDGEGIRTIVFFKGCPLRCKWCSNPESQERRSEVAQNTGRCLGTAACGYCLKACSGGALSVDGLGLPPKLDRRLCDGCLACAAVCPSKALTAYGETRAVEDVLAVVEQDSVFYARSGGGLTLSGGEPLMQPDFALALLREARARHMNTAMETCGMAAWESLDAACAQLSEILFDIKVMDPKKHLAATGRDNGIILENFAKMRAKYPDLPTLVRTPVIPGVNDSPEDIQAIVDFVRCFPDTRYELLPYHRLGTQKYAFLHREYPMGDRQLDGDMADRLAALVKKAM